MSMALRSLLVAVLSIILVGCGAAAETPPRATVTPDRTSLDAKATIDAALAGTASPTPRVIAAWVPAQDSGPLPSPTAEIAPTSTESVTALLTDPATSTSAPTSTSTATPLPAPTATETATSDRPATAPAQANAMGTAIAATLEAVATATALAQGVEAAVAATQTALAARSPTATRTPAPPPPPSPTPTAVAPPATLTTLRLVYAFGDVGRSDIEIFDVDDGSMWAVADQACDEAEPGWAPDGRTVVYQSDCRGSYDIYVVDVESGSTRQVTATAHADEREPDVSPDGNWIVYRSNSAGSDRNADGALYLMDLNGDGVRALGLSGRAPDWSPSGRQLAYMSQVSGSWEIYVYDLDSGANRQLTACAANCRFPAWSPDGRQVIYHTTTAAGNATPDSIWMIAAGGGSPVPLVGGDNPGRPSWSRSGLIAFNSNRGIEVVNEQGDRRRTVLNGNVHWAPDWSR